VSLTAPIKPIPPTVPAVKLQPVESGSQNTAQTEPPAEKKMAEHTAEKPTVSAKTEPASSNTTIINKVEPNNQNKVPLLNSSQNSESTNANTTQAADTPPAAQNKLSSFDLYASMICVILFAVFILFFFWRQKTLRKKPLFTTRQSNEKKESQRSKAASPRTIIDYSTDNTKEIIDMLTSSTDIQPGTIQNKNKINKEVKSNFEFRV
jgi:hypothetical protein